MKWLKRIGAMFAALAALWFGLIYRKHDKRARKSLDRLRELNEQEIEQVAEAEKARDEAIRHEDKAIDALAKGNREIGKVRQKDEPMGDIVADLNRKLRGK